VTSFGVGAKRFLKEALEKKRKAIVEKTALGKPKG
jgi:hypothetical protein